MRSDHGSVRRPVLAGIGLLLLASLVEARSTPSASAAQEASAGALRGQDRASASSDLTKEEALRLAFKDCEVESRVVYLTEKERARANELAGFDVGSSVLHAYVASKQGKAMGTAWFDVHLVRTKKEVLMFVVNAAQEIQRLEVVAFSEPPDYRPRASWYAQFLGRKLDEELQLGRGIKSVTGATLTARATALSARRMLAMHRVAVVEREKTGAATSPHGLRIGAQTGKDG